MSTESGSDYIWVYTCTDINCGNTTLLAQLSGTQAGSYTSETGYILVRFTSDDSVQNDGFTAMWALQVSMCSHLRVCCGCSAQLSVGLSVEL